MLGLLIVRGGRMGSYPLGLITRVSCDYVFILIACFFHVFTYSFSVLVCFL